MARHVSRLFPCLYVPFVRLYSSPANGAYKQRNSLETSRASGTRDMGAGLVVPRDCGWNPISRICYDKSFIEIDFFIWQAISSESQDSKLFVQSQQFILVIATAVTNCVFPYYWFNGKWISRRIQSKNQYELKYPSGLMSIISQFITSLKHQSTVERTDRVLS